MIHVTENPCINLYLIHHTWTLIVTCKDIYLDDMQVNRKASPRFGTKFFVAMLHAKMAWNNEDIVEDNTFDMNYVSAMLCHLNQMIVTG